MNLLDSNYDISDLSRDAMNKSKKDVVAFYRKAQKIVGDGLMGKSWSDIGHDFWLTRNGHGAGFWDGDYLEPAGKLLTNLSKQFREVDLYVGDDGQLHI